MWSSGLFFRLFGSHDSFLVSSSFSFLWFVCRGQTSANGCLHSFFLSFLGGETHTQSLRIEETVPDRCSPTYGISKMTHSFQACFLSSRQGFVVLCRFARASSFCTCSHTWVWALNHLSILKTGTLTSLPLYHPFQFSMTESENPLILHTDKKQHETSKEGYFGDSHDLSIFIWSDGFLVVFFAQMDLDWSIRGIDFEIWWRTRMGNNSRQCLWAGMYPRVNKSQQSSLPKSFCSFRQGLAEIMDLFFQN